ncbi:MAG: hypothetical protein IH596_12550 [Bacteroidales bacterium]|nr:hypothetical protein [Bacteroidales bacterium]
MKKRKRLFILLGLAVVLMAALVIVGIRYVPWHKFIKVPTSDELAFIQKNPLQNTVPNSLSFNFEMDSTQATPGRIYKGIAHSGSYSAKVFGKNSFSVNVVQRAGDIGLENLNGVALSAWIYVFPTTNEVNGSLVFSVNNSVGANICWKGCSLSGPLIPTGEWFKMSGYFNLSDVRLRSDDQIQLYFWNNSDTEILVDDLYYVFGAQRERPGDSARVDMTREPGYTAQFNFPPFRTQWMQKQPIGNGDNLFLIARDQKTEGEITPADQVIAGNFITPKGTLQSMLVISPEGKPSLYHYCNSTGTFAEILLECDPTLYPLLRGGILQKGSFVQSSGDQLFIAGPRGMALLGFEATTDLCGRKPADTRMKVLWQLPGNTLADVPLTDALQVTSGNFYGNGTDELLLFGNEGSWKILRFSPSGSSASTWKTMASGEEYKIREWNKALMEFKATAAPYLPACKNDLVLTRFRDLKTGNDGYTLLRFLPGNNKFVKAFSDSRGSLGMTIGIDTLKMTDLIIPGRFLPGQPISFLRYNRDWRFDMKDIRFNDSTFQILNNIDFTGYSSDQNPKYYEILRLHAGNWLDPDVTSVMVIARNCSDPDYHGGDCNGYEENPDLPNTLQLYSFTPNKP